MTALPFAGPVVADTSYVNNELVAKDLEIALPEVAAVTTEIQAMGTMEVPIWQLIENMEAVITKIGTDMGLVKMIGPKPIDLENRFVHISTDANGVTRNVGCKVFLKCVSKNIPGVEIIPGEPMENEVKLTVSRYQFFVDGEELWLIDKLAGILRIGGKDYSTDINNML